MNPNNVSVTGQAAAIAALRDQAYMHETCAQTIRIRDQFIDRMRCAGVAAPDSFTNFALLKFDTTNQAKHVDSKLRQQGVFVRPQGGAHLPECLRVTVGEEKEMNLVANCIEAILDREVSSR